MRTRWRWALTPLFCLTAWSACSAPRSVKSEPTSAPAQPPPPVRLQPRVVDFQPGIHIDYSTPHVEVAGKVILREGQLELFAYSKAAAPKEHETILMLAARPLHIYQALGLIGLVPGRPLSYDWETKKTTLASGDPVDVFVRYEEDGETVERSACEWMRDVARDEPMKPTPWLFTGSARDAEGRFRADLDGTVVTGVHFDSSLLSLVEAHSESHDARVSLARERENERVVALGHRRGPGRRQRLYRRRHPEHGLPHDSRRLGRERQ